MKKIFASFLFLYYPSLSAMISARFEREDHWDGSEHLKKEEIDFEVAENGFDNPRDLLEDILEKEIAAEKAMSNYFTLLSQRKQHEKEIATSNFSQNLEEARKKHSDTLNAINNKKNHAIKKKLN